MTRQRRSAGTKMSDYLYSPVDFSVEDKIEINVWLDSRQLDFATVYQEMVEAGYKLSSSFTKGNEYSTLTLTETRTEQRKGKLHVYSFRHVDPIKGLMVLYWFFMTHLDAGDSRHAKEGDTYDW